MTFRSVPCTSEQINSPKKNKFGQWVALKELKAYLQPNGPVALALAVSLHELVFLFSGSAGSQHVFPSQSLG